MDSEKMVDKDRLDNLDEVLDNLIEYIREAGVITCDYKGEGNYPKRMNDLVEKLADLNSLKTSFTNVMVPEEVFTKIDSGHNPQLYTRECIERSLAKNEQVKGQLDSLSRLRALLMNEMSETFPAEMAHYRRMKGETGVPPPTNPDSEPSQSNDNKI